MPIVIEYEICEHAMMKQSNKFQKQLLSWFDKHGRKNLPWQVENSYFVWISEIMLQQTQVTKVIDYFNAFIKRFPTIKILAEANVSDILQMWSGLGYYNRARNIHKTAKICCNEFNGELPKDLKQLMKLSGIGRTTAGAILSLSHNLPFPILDGNVKRVISRVYGVKADKLSQLDKELWKIVETNISTKRPKDYNQALMDLGSLVCKRSKPLCSQCPFSSSCKAYINNETDIYPQKKSVTKKISMTMYALLIEDENHMYLQQRPVSGIWPELWFLPLYKNQKDIVGVSNINSSSFEITHVLTHRILTIKVTSVKSNSALKSQFRKVNKTKITTIPHPTALIKVMEKM